METNITFMNNNLHKKSYLESFLEKISPTLLKTYTILFKLVFCVFIIPIIGKITGKLTSDLNDIVKSILMVSLKKINSESKDVIAFLSGKAYKIAVEPVISRIPFLNIIISLIKAGEGKVSELDSKFFNMVGRRFFDKDTLYVIQLFMNEFNDILDPKKQINWKSTDGVKKLSTASAALFGLFDCLLCGIKSSLCNRLRVFEKMAYLAPLIGEMFMEMYNATRDLKYNPNDKGEFLFNAFVKYCDNCLDAGIRGKIEADKDKREREEKIKEQKIIEQQQAIQKEKEQKLREEQEQQLKDKEDKLKQKNEADIKKMEEIHREALVIAKAESDAILKAKEEIIKENLKSIQQKVQEKEDLEKKKK